jgi:hypothetical protein
MMYAATYDFTRRNIFYSAFCCCLSHNYLKFLSSKGLYISRMIAGYFFSKYLRDYNGDHFTLTTAVTHSFFKDAEIIRQ